MSAEYVHLFFERGLLRLSSFNHFRRHPDESRLDAQEGRAKFVARTPENGGKTITADCEYGTNSFVLCGSLFIDADLKRKFNTDSYFRINNTVAFASVIARNLPGVVYGAEGICLYQRHKVLQEELPLSAFDTSSSIPNSDGSFSPELPRRAELERSIHERVQIDAMFLKSITYQNEREYRLVWVTSRPTEGYVDILVPEAREFCSQPNGFDE